MESKESFIQKRIVLLKFFTSQLKKYKLKSKKLKNKISTLTKYTHKFKVKIYDFKFNFKYSLIQIRWVVLLTLYEHDKYFPVRDSDIYDLDRIMRKLHKRQKVIKKLKKKQQFVKEMIFLLTQKIENSFL